MNYPPAFEFDYDSFIAAFPFFSDPTIFPESTLQGDWNIASIWISNYDSFCFNVNGDGRNYALNLMTAHIAYLSNNAANNKINGIITNATVDKVSVGLKPPPESTQLVWWLNLTPYGSQLAALLQAAGVGGLLTNGTPESFAIRGYGGFYGNSNGCGNGFFGNGCH